MPLYFETHYAGGGLARIPLQEDQTVVVAQAGARYRIATADGEPVEAEGLRVTRTAQDLFVRGLPGDHVVTIQDFFLVCRFEAACQLQLDSLGDPGEAITPLSSAFATGNDGLLLWAASQDSDNDEDDDEDDEDDDRASSLDLLLTGGLGVAAVGVLGAGIGSGSDSTAVADDGDEQLASDEGAASDSVTGNTDTEDTDADDADSDDTQTEGTETEDTDTEESNTEDADSGNSATAGGDSDDSNGDDSNNNGGTATGDNADAQTGGSDAGDDDIDPVSPPAPVVTIDSVLDNEPAGTGWFGPGIAVNDLTPVITGSVTDLPDDGAVQLLRDGELLGLTALNTNQWAFTDTLPGDGIYNYEAIVTDPSGATVSGSTAYSLRIDTSAPAAPTLAPVTGDNIVTPVEAQSGFSLEGTAEPGAQVLLTWGNESDSVLASDDGSWSLAINTAPSGISLLQLVAEDQAQNRSDTLTRVVQVVSPSGNDGALGEGTAATGWILSAEWLTGHLPPTA